MKALFAMILLMITATYGCTTGDSTVVEQVATDVIEVGDIVVEDVEEPVSLDTEVLDDSDTVPTVEEVEN